MGEALEAEWDAIKKASFPYKPEFGNRYKLTQEELGRGTFGVVYRAEVKNSRAERAVKVVYINDLEREYTVFKKEMMIKEIKAMRLLGDHPNILRLYETFTQVKPGGKQMYFYMALFYANRNSLEKIMTDPDDETRLEPIPPGRVKSYIRQVVVALNYCYDKLTIHRDLKLGNVLIYAQEKGLERAILSDFGRAKISEPPKDLDADFMNKPVTTLKYRCPEMLKNANYSYRCDLWSLGVLMYVMLSGKFPFEGDEATIKRTIQTVGVSFDDPIWEDKEAESHFIETCLLIEEPLARKGYIKMLKHDWLKVENIDDTI